MQAENETVTENEELPTSKIPTTEEEEEQQETLELPGAEDSATPVTESEGIMCMPCYNCTVPLVV